MFILELQMISVKESYKNIQYCLGEFVGFNRRILCNTHIRKNEVGILLWESAALILWILIISIVLRRLCVQQRQLSLSACRTRWTACRRSSAVRMCAAWRLRWIRLRLRRPSAWRVPAHRYPCLIAYPFLVSQFSSLATNSPGRNAWWILFCQND